MPATTGHIEYLEQEGNGIVFTDLRVALPHGQVAPEPWRVELQPGERLLIMGRRGVGKSAMFQAMAGIWPWGQGAIQMPPRATLMFIPQRPYLPLASLRAAVTYPSPAGEVAADAIPAALERVGLGHLLPLLDQDQRWDRDLTLEQQRLTLARLLLHRPKAVFMDEALGALDVEHRELCSRFSTRSWPEPPSSASAAAPWRTTSITAAFGSAGSPARPACDPATELATARQPDLWPGAAPVIAPMPDPADEVRSGRR